MQGRVTSMCVIPGICSVEHHLHEQKWQWRQKPAPLTRPNPFSHRDLVWRLCHWIMNLTWNEEIDRGMSPSRTRPTGNQVIEVTVVLRICYITSQTFLPRPKGGIYTSHVSDQLIVCFWLPCILVGEASHLEVREAIYLPIKMFECPGSF